MLIVIIMAWFRIYVSLNRVIIGLDNDLAVPS